MRDRYPEANVPSNPIYITIQSPEGVTPDFSGQPHNYPGQLLEGTEAAQALQGYEEAGKHLQPPKIPEDELLLVDGTLFHANWNTGDEWGVYRDRLDPRAMVDRLDGVGNFRINDSRLAFINEGGQLMVARPTPDNIRSLQFAGYVSPTTSVTGRIIAVPFCNGNLPPQGSRADLQLRLFEALSQRDALQSGATPSTTDLLSVGSGVSGAASIATREVTELETQEGYDRRVTDEIDPDRPRELDHTIQSLKDEIALMKMTEMGM